MTLQTSGTNYNHQRQLSSAYTKTFKFWNALDLWVRGSSCEVTYFDPYLYFPSDLILYHDQWPACQTQNTSIFIPSTLSSAGWWQLTNHHFLWSDKQFFAQRATRVNNTNRRFDVCSGRPDAYSFITVNLKRPRLRNSELTMDWIKVFILMRENPKFESGY